MLEPRIVVCLSGGPDSILYAEIARRSGSGLTACMFVNYGQPAVQQEKEVCECYCRATGIPLYVSSVSLTGMSEMNGSPCASGNRVVPGRNGVIVSMALNLAASIGANEVWLGAIKDDTAGYADCTPDWIERMDDVAKFGFDASSLHVRAPLNHWSKAKVLNALMKYGVNISETWSCYNPNNGAQCGECNSCRLIKTATDQIRK